MSDFICPVCGGELIKKERTYACGKGHSFDIAKSGYVNLLPSSGKGKRHGDDKRMVKARTELFRRGHYDNLSDLIADLADHYSEKGVRVLDAGCGEGKYTCEVLSRLSRSGKAPTVLGIDISKDALIQAAKRSKALRLAAASSAALPLPDGSIDLILNIFSPFMGGEFCRVLRPGGKLIRAYPLARHLWELKELIYDRPYENPVTDMEEEGFRILERREIRYGIHLADNEEIMSLFQMTPYYYKTGAADQAKAQSAQSLDTTLEFGVVVYENINGGIHNGDL